MAGYSGTPLPRKLGIRPGQRIAFLDVPAEVHREIGPLPADVRTSESLQGRGPLDLILLFVTRGADLARRFPLAARRLDRAGMLWIAWPKKRSKQPSELTENLVRDIGLAEGLVDVKVCAIDETWSGLKFVRRLADRPKT